MKTGAPYPYIDEGRLHTRQDSHHFAGVYIAHDATVDRTFNVNILGGTIFHQGYPCFHRSEIDQNFFTHWSTS